jgi:hypothetical protein
MSLQCVSKGGQYYSSARPSGQVRAATIGVAHGSAGAVTRRATHESGTGLANPDSRSVYAAAPNLLTRRRIGRFPRLFQVGGARNWKRSRSKWPTTWWPHLNGLFLDRHHVAHASAPIPAMASASSRAGAGRQSRACADPRKGGRRKVRKTLVRTARRDSLARIR